MKKREESKREDYLRNLMVVIIIILLAVVIYVGYKGITGEAIILPPEPVGDGLKAVYYDNIDFTGASITRDDSQINFVWSRGIPHASIGADTFSARWEGYIKPDVSGSYNLYIYSDDGVRVYVDDVLVINDWSIHSARERSGTASLTAGNYHKIRVEYFENKGSAVVKLSWSSASVPKSIIPKNNLYTSIPEVVYSTEPICQTGTSGEGWYLSGALIIPDSCTCAAECRNMGTASEGWFSCYGELIEQVDCDGSATGSEDWSKDGISLMRNKLTNQYGCFGCSSVLCVDPDFANVENVAESQQLHCDTTFKVVGVLACNDGIDNDADGKIDYPTDEGCSGATDGDETNIVSIPSTPSGLIATALSTTSIKLDWKDVSGEDNYRIDRALSAAGPWTHIVSPTAGILTFTDSELVAATNYYYRIRACNNAGCSGYSTIVNARTTPVVQGTSQCNDGVDNDGDGLVDYQYDTGCAALTDDEAGVAARSRGWTVIDKSADTVIVYVSSSDGNDANDGLSPQNPKKTMVAGISKLNSLGTGKSNWLLLKRGDVFGRMDSLSVNGKSDAQPILISSYGSSFERPRIEFNKARKESAFWQSGGRQYIAIIGLHFRGYYYNGEPAAYAIQFIGPNKNVLLEDNLVEGANDLIIVQRSVDTDILTYPQYFKIRRNVLLDSPAYYSSAGAMQKGQAIYTSKIKHILVEENIMHHIGWIEKITYDPNAKLTQMTIYSHSGYIQSGIGNEDIVWKGNVIGDGDGVQLRPGGVFENNVLFKTGYTGVFTGNPNANNIIRGNVFMDNINRMKYSTGVNLANAHPVEVKPADNTLIENNLIVNTYEGGGKAIEIAGTTSDDCGCSYDVIITKNTLYNAGIGIDFNSAVLDSATISSNIIQTDGDFCTEDSTKATFTNNVYYCGVANTIASAFNGKSFQQWKESKESSARSSQVTFRDSSRNLAKYHGTLGKTATHDAFVAELRKQGKFNYRDEYTSEAIIDYMKEGFTPVNLAGGSVNLNAGVY